MSGGGATPRDPASREGVKPLHLGTENAPQLLRGLANWARRIYLDGGFSLGQMDQEHSTHRGHSPPSKSNVPVTVIIAPEPRTGGASKLLRSLTSAGSISDRFGWLSERL
jgi:hypothetical protein